MFELLMLFFRDILIIFFFWDIKAQQDSQLIVVYKD